MKLHLDTSALIELERGSSAVAHLLSRFEVAISAAALAEYALSVARDTRPDLSARGAATLERVLGFFDFLQAGVDAARRERRRTDA